MEITVKLKAIYLNRMLWYLVGIGVIGSLSIFIGLNIDIIYRYSISMMIIFASILIVFFLNRNELELLIIKGDTLELSFLNKAFFKRKNISCSKDDTNVKIEADIVKIYLDKNIIGVVRKESIDMEDWERIIKYFSNVHP